MKLTFKPIQRGIEIVDQIERHHYRIMTHGRVTPTAIKRDQIQHPVDAAAEITTSGLSHVTNTVYVYDKEGSLIEEVKPNEQISLSSDTYVLDLSGPVKVYAQIEAPIQIYTKSGQTHVKFGESTQVIIGARSYHTRPAGTITTTAAPTDVMQAVSTFGSALKTTTPERSYSTLRGHPPAIELGDRLDISEEIERPETGIQIKVPKTLKHIFVVAPLAYYLGGKIIPGSQAQIVTRNGYVYNLDGECGFEAVVERLLKHVFFLDCVVRTEGISPGRLHERQKVEPIIDFDISSVYRRSLAEQLEIYMEIPFNVTESIRPEWQFETLIKLTTESIELLPFIIDNFAIVKTYEGTRALSEMSKTQSIERSLPSTTFESNSYPITHQHWKSPNSKDITSTTTLSAFHNNIDRTPRTDPISINVICNDTDMSEELVSVYGTYGNREELPLDVKIHNNLKVNELKEVLSRESDFVHYIGHIDRDGFRCIDGKLNAESMRTISTKAFFLNACQSYHQGLALIEKGAIGGIVTLDEINNDDAVTIGGTVAQLLNQGFPLYAAVDIIRRKDIAGEQYHIVGNGLTTVARSKNGTSISCTINRTNGDLSVSLSIYFQIQSGIGSVCFPYLQEISKYHLIPKKVGPLSVTKPHLVEFLDMEEIPVFIDGDVRWSSDIKIREL